MRKKKIYLLFTDLEKVGGAKNVVIDLFEGLQSQYHVIVSSYDEYENINDKYKKIVPNEYYEKLNYIKLIRTDAIIMSHHRKITTLLILFSIGRKRNFIHVAHNEFDNLRYFTFYPNKIIAVSNRVKENLIQYFKCEPKAINMIYNGISDNKPKNDIKTPNKKIKILYPARITNIKNQTMLVKELKDNISNDIEIYFAGDGPLYEELKELCNNSTNFFTLGFRSDILDLYRQFDYVMLFTKREGLPISLIEATMMGIPIICNDVGGNVEIVENKYNGFICNNISSLIKCINDLKFIKKDAYLMLSKNARKKYTENFEKYQMIDKYKYLIDEFINEQ